MISRHVPPPLDATICHVSQEPILSDPAWTDIPMGKDYKVTFRLLGERILLTTPAGNMGTVDMVAYYEQRETFLKAHNLAEGPLAEIRDFALTYGRPTKEGRVVQAKSLKKEKGRLRAFVILRPKWLVKMLFKVGQMMFESPCPILPIDSYEEALKKAERLLSTEGTGLETGLEDFECRPEWRFQNDSFQVEYRVLPGRCLYGRGVGNLRTKEADAAIAINEDILREGHFSAHNYYRIVDYSGAQNSTWRGRLRLGRGMEDLYNRYNCAPAAYIICGAAPRIRAMALMARYLHSHPVMFMASVEDALAYMRAHPHGPEQRPSSFWKRLFSRSSHDTVQITNNQIRELLHAIGTISWDAENPEATGIDEKHPLKAIYDALSVVSMDINRMLQERLQTADEMASLQEQLHHAERMRAIGQLAGGIAHDFNNQLSVICGYAELMNEEAESARAVRLYAGRILRAGRHSTDLTKKLLAFARKGKYRTEPVDLHWLIGDVVSILKHTIKKKIVIEQDLCRGPVVTKGDAPQLQNALLNLALNAEDAMPESGTLTFQTRRVCLEQDNNILLAHDLRAGSYIELRVSDTGTGMDRETRKRIFEPFFTTKPVGKGTGMGLASVYGTLQNHGGAIDCESTKGSGTTFTLWLPEAEAMPGTRRAKAQAVVPTPEHRTILVIEDEEDVINMIEAMLGRAGYDITVCLNGTDALRAFDDKSYDLVMLDMRMPKMDGPEVFRALRDRKAEQKILLMSGYSLDTDARALLDAGAAGFLPKPFDLYHMTDTVHRAIHGLPIE